MQGVLKLKKNSGAKRLNVIPGGVITTRSKQNVTDRYLTQFNDWATGWKTKGLSLQWKPTWCTIYPQFISSVNLYMFRAYL